MIFTLLFSLGVSLLWYLIGGQLFNMDYPEAQDELDILVNKEELNEKEVSYANKISILIALYFGPFSWVYFIGGFIGDCFGKVKNFFKNNGTQKED